MFILSDRRRITAVKCRISDLVSGSYVKQEGFKPNYVLTEDGRKLSRVRIMAVLTNKFLSEDGNYAFVVLDDSTETIRSKAFQDIAVFNNVNVGDTVDFIGKIREYNEERYLVPELLVPITDPNLETLRRLDIVKAESAWKGKRKAVIDAKPAAGSEEEIKAAVKEKAAPEEVEGVLESLDSEEEKKTEEGEEKAAEEDDKNARKIIIETITELDVGEGVEFGEIIEKANLADGVVESVINELLGEGVCYEPRAGKIKVL